MNIEALFEQHNYYASEMLIAMLSLSENNVDSLANIQRSGRVDKLGLLVSDYWYAHERRRDGGVPYITRTLGGEGFAFAAAAVHTKIVLIKTLCGKRLVLHGSANLRSSRNVEQFTIVNDEMLYNFNAEWIGQTINNFCIDKKSLRGEKLWQTLPGQVKKEN